MGEKKESNARNKPAHLAVPGVSEQMQRIEAYRIQNKPINLWTPLAIIIACLKT